MRILARYVLREFMVPFTYCLLGFVAVYMLIDTVEQVGEIIKAAPPKSLVLQYMAGRVSICLEWLLPACLLLASLYTMWQFCRNSEIIAMRANGVSFLTITWPMLAVAAITGSLCWANVEYIAPHWGERSDKIKRAKFESLDADVRHNVPFNNSPANRLWIVGTLDGANPNTLQHVKIAISRPDGSKHYDIEAEAARYLDGAWWLVNPRWQYYDEFNSPIKHPNPEQEKITFISMPDYDETPQDFLLQNKRREFYSNSERLRYLQTHPKLGADDKASIRYDYCARYAIPASCIIITLFAIPAGVATGRQSIFKGILTAIALFFGFYAAVTICMLLAHRQALPPLFAAWLPNLLFLLAGLTLYYKQR